MATLTINIGLGNDAMQSGDDVAGALRALADHYARYGAQPLRHPWTPPHTVRDGNGNVVGGASVTADADDAPDDADAPTCAREVREASTSLERAQALWAADEDESL